MITINMGRIAIKIDATVYHGRPAEPRAEQEDATYDKLEELGKIMLGRLAHGCTIGYHKHETSSEIIYILSGQADFLYDEGTETALPGGCHYCPKGHSHSMINRGTEDVVFFAVVPEQ